MTQPTLFSNTPIIKTQTLPQKITTKNPPKFSMFNHHKVELKRWAATFLTNHKTLFSLLWFLAFASLFLWQKKSSSFIDGFSVRRIPRLRDVVFNVTDFGAVGDGFFDNTAAFETAVAAIAKKGGGQLNVPRGVWLTCPFNLTNHFTLFLAEDAVILGVDIGDLGDRSLGWPRLLFFGCNSRLNFHYGSSANSLLYRKAAYVCGMPLPVGNSRGTVDEEKWPLMPPLPSYGYGREHPGPRYGSLIHGQNLRDVVITGHNGTIDGQGQTWWKKYRQKKLNHTRGPLVQIMWSSDIVIDNVTLRNSPFWTLHPYDCKNVTIRNVTILAPVLEAPNTDGIDPDSCEDMVIEDCYISVGDDGIAIKSGWDQYGIAYGRPSKNILIRNLVVRSMVSAGVSIGSEMSGGVSNVTVENVLVWSSRRAVRIKTAPGRGGYVRQITYRNLTFDEVRVGIVIKTDYNEHPDEGYDPKALPVIEDISFISIHGHGVRVPVRIYGSEEIPIKNITFRDVSVGISYKKKRIFQCAYVHGRVIGTIFPAPCENLDLYDENGRLVRPSSLQNITDIDYNI